MKKTWRIILIGLFISSFFLTCCKKKITCYECWKNLNQPDQVIGDVCVDESVSKADLLTEYGYDGCDLKK